MRNSAVPPGCISTFRPVPARARLFYFANLKNARGFHPASSSFFRANACTIEAFLPGHFKNSSVASMARHCSCKKRLRQAHLCAAFFVRANYCAAYFLTAADQIAHAACLEPNREEGHSRVILCVSGNDSR